MTIDELNLARKLNIPCIVNGFQKSQELIELAKSQAEYIVIEGDHEIDQLQEITKRSQESIKVLMRIKVKHGAKLGCSQQAIIKAASSNILSIIGLHFHLGWNVKDYSAIDIALESINKTLKVLVSFGKEVEIINCGGSFCEHSFDQSQARLRE